jgi:hypothetical protein
MVTRKVILTSAILVATVQAAMAGGEPSRSYYPAPAPYYAPPVIVTAPWPNPIDGLVGGVLAIPGVVLGGLFGAIAPPPVVSCVGPDGSLFPCPAGAAPVYPAYGAGYGGQGPLPLPPATPGPSQPACYGPDGSWQGGGSPDCSY